MLKLFQLNYGRNVIIRLRFTVPAGAAKSSPLKIRLLRRGQICSAVSFFIRVRMPESFAGCQTKKIMVNFTGKIILRQGVFVMFDKLMDSDNGLVITMNWITDCLFLSMLWLLLSVFLIPFGPATAALYDTAVHTFRMGEKVVYRRFFASVRKNLKTGIPAGMIALAIVWGGFGLWNRIGAAAADSHVGYALLWGFFVLILLVLGMLSFLFPLLSRFETNLARLFGNCVLLCMANLPRTIALSLLSAVSIWLCLWLWWPVIFVPCLSAVVSSFFIEPVFAPFLPSESGDAGEAEE